jgi:NAD(P)H-flavin reductase
MSVSSRADRSDPWLSYPARIRRVIPEAPSVATYELAIEDPSFAASFCFQPGQFNMLYVPGVGEAAISISSDPAEPQRLLHTIRTVGGVTQAIASGGPGYPLGIRGPFGSAWPIAACLERPASPPSFLIVAGGIGLAPLRPAIYALLQRRQEVDQVGVLVGARTPADMLYESEFDRWRAQGIDVQVTVDRPQADWPGKIGVVTALVDRWPMNHPGRTIVLACGPEVMMRYVAQAAMRRKVSAANIWLSMERHMNCAVGLCGHCQLGPDFLCKDGPVLPFPRLAESLKVHGL